MESESTPRQSRTGLKRPNYGPMKYRVFKKYPTTPHVTKRRTILDDSVLEALHQTHIGPLSNYVSGASGVGSSGENDIGATEQLDDDDRPKDSQPELRADDNRKWSFGTSAPQYMPQTPKRDSRSFIIAPGSGRRTPRRRSRSSSQFQRTTPLKALADANQARVNRLIHEANRRGRVGRDKHSPMGIMRLLSRIPGFNPPLESQSDRQQIPGSANWRKLTPKSPRTKYIQMEDDPNNPLMVSTQNVQHNLNIGTKRQGRDVLSSAERLAFEFKDQNPFLDPDEFYKLWEDELGVTREGGRISFGLGGPEENYALTDDGDTREFVTQGELVDPFTAPTDGIETRPLHIGDITNTSQHGFLGEHEQAEQNESTVHVYERNEKYYYQGASGNTYVEFEAELNESSFLRSTQASQQSSEDADIESIGQSQSEVSDVAEGFTNTTTTDGKMTPQQEGDIDMEDGWEDILDDDNETQGSIANHQSLETTSTADRNSDMEMTHTNDDQPMTDQNNQEDLETRPLQEEDEHIAGHASDDMVIPNDDVAEEEQNVGNEDREDQAVPEDEQLEYEDGYINANDEEHIERQEHNEQDRSGVHYFDDFPSEIGIMSSGQVLPTSLPAPKRAVRLSAAGIPVPSMPAPLQKQLINTFSRSRVSREAMAVIMEGSHQFFEQASNDLAAYAGHAGRKTIDESDVECLMKRLRITNDKVSIESLLQRYLPRELRDKVLYPEDLQPFRRR
ncbi:hypothetical protein BGZ76_009917 [Entomortierella beljakovae]|nr:hypothetical protein BGZ76_009917 [Entomortierella beljakovae]